MAAVRPQVQVLIPTVIGAGTPVVCAIPGTATPGSHTTGGVAPHFLLQKGWLSNNSANAVHLALVNGTAVAAGTVAVLMVPINSCTPFDLTAGGDRYEGVKIDALGGLAIKYVGTSLGTAGTVSATVKIKDILQ